jgi:type I restriction enzyme, S subunit
MSDGNGQVPDGWELTQLQDVLTEVRNGSTANQNQAGDTVPITRIETISEWKVNYSKVGHVARSKALERFALVKGDILLSHINSMSHIGKVALYGGEQPLYHGMNLLMLRYAHEYISYQYLYQILSNEKTNRALKLKAKQAINQASLNIQDIKSTQILLPPLPEQKKIASILTSVDDVIEKTEAQISKLQDLKKGMMTELLTTGINHTEFKDSAVGRIPVSWEVISLGEIIEKIHSGWSPTCDSRPRTGSEWGILKTTAVVWEGYCPTETKHLPEGLSSRGAATVQHQDILVTRKGPRDRVGVCAYVNEPSVNLMIPDTVFRILLRKNCGCSPEYISKALSSNYVQIDWNRKKIGLAEAQVNINHGILKETLVAIPHIDEQKKIIEILDATQADSKAKQKKLSHTKSLKKALMNDLLTGKVRVSTTN